MSRLPIWLGWWPDGNAEVEGRIPSAGEYAIVPAAQGRDIAHEMVADWYAIDDRAQRAAQIRNHHAVVVARNHEMIA